MRVLVISPGSSYSTADVDAGLRAGLEVAGVDVVRYRLTERLGYSRRELYRAWQQAKRQRPDIVKPTRADIYFHAGAWSVIAALYQNVDAVIVVTAMFLHPDVFVLLSRARIPVCVLFTESPYDTNHELRVARLASGVWTHERTCVERFRAANSRAGYVPHAWIPERHTPQVQPSDQDVPAHDVVFVGSGFPERVAWLEQIDWTGIDLGLYGHWKLKQGSPLIPFVRAGTTGHETTTALYRRAKVAINLYRDAPGAESLNPRAYELARCGVPSVSSPRAEVGEVFDDLIPQVETAPQAEAAIRSLLARPGDRRDIAASLPNRVVGHSWHDRARLVAADVQSLIEAVERREYAAAI